ncbi:PhzF family phenazine biosynthesis protein [Nguyenibacter vanlangensis]|uniref:PhzF family phenazine biosynthesis protein n=1 Tax=Nguyenibacter vanlangensis TaxID=1216886 RepID=A0ABZ3D7V2_9PROT
MAEFAFHQVDVFATRPFGGNPLAVVTGADGLTDAQMAAFANWTNLSETTFLLRPTHPDADYRVRIFTPQQELPFAGHPTLGTCHVWLQQGGVPRGRQVVQECPAGLVPVRRQDAMLAFAAPPLRRAGAVEADVLAAIARGLHLPPDSIRASNWADNGPGWVAVMLRSRAELLSVRPDYAALGDLKVGLVAPFDTAPDRDDALFEVRAFTGGPDGVEDPVTGSLNASLAMWMIGAGLAPPSYVARQGTVLGRRGRIAITSDAGEIWVGGTVVTAIEGRVTI